MMMKSKDSQAARAHRLLSLPGGARVAEEVELIVLSYGREREEQAE
jgi:hypothetical protein